MEASVFATEEHDGGEEGDAWSDLETLRKLYGLLDKTAESNDEELLDHKSRCYLMKLLDEKTQHTLTHQMKIFPSSPAAPYLANTSSICGLGQGYNQGLEQNLNNSMRYSFQRRDSNHLKSQFSIKSRQSQAHYASSQVPSHPYHPMSQYHDYRTKINSSSKHRIGDMPEYQYHRVKPICSPSEGSFSSAPKMTEMTTKKLGVSRKERTNTTSSQVHLDKDSSQFKIANQYVKPTQEFSTDGTTSSSESNSRTLGKVDKRTLHHRRLPTFDCKKKSGDYLAVDSNFRSNSVTSSSTCSSSSSLKGGLGALPIVPFQKPSHLPIVPYKKPGRRLNSFSKKPSISPHDHNKSMRRIQSTRHHKLAKRNSKKLAKASDEAEQKKRRFKQLKDKLAIVFHHRHDHHHYHHHNSREVVSNKSRDVLVNKDHHHRSPWKFLKGILQHSSEKTIENVPSQKHHLRHLRALLHMLFGHLWGNKQRKKPRLQRTGSRVRVKKLRWWHKFRRVNGKKTRLRLRH